MPVLATTGGRCGPMIPHFNRRTSGSRLLGDLAKRQADPLQTASESMELEKLRSRYLALFDPDPTGAGEFERIESELDVQLPVDLKVVATFYSGGIIGGISHHAISSSGPATSIVEETKRLRTHGLPHSMLVLAEPPESLTVMRLGTSIDSPAVIWCDAIDFCRIGNVRDLHRPQTWTSYAQFFEFLLDREVEEREELS